MYANSLIEQHTSPKKDKNIYSIGSIHWVYPSWMQGNCEQHFSLGKPLVVLKRIRSLLICNALAVTRCFTFHLKTGPRDEYCEYLGENSVHLSL